MQQPLRRMNSSSYLPVLDLGRSDGFHVVQCQNGLHQMKSVTLVLSGFQNIGLGTNGTGQRHDNPLPEGIDRRVRYLYHSRR